MGRHKVYIILMLIAAVYTSCRQVQGTEQFFDEGRMEGNVYINDTIGWKMEIPATWKLSHRITQKVKDEFSSWLDSMDVQHPSLSSYVQLLSIEKDRLNIFRSNYDKKKGEDVNERMLRETMQTYCELLPYLFPPPVQVIYCSPVEKKRIRGKTFLYLSYECYLPAPLDKKLYGMAYMGVVNNYVLEVTINYTDEKNKDEIMNAWLNSKF